MKDISVPNGVEKYKNMDLKLLDGEKVEKILGMSPVSKFRSFVVCGLVAFLGFVLYNFFSQPVVTAESLILPVVVFIATYFIWHCKVTESGKNLVSSLVKYSIQIALLTYLTTFIASLLGPLLKVVNAPSFSLNPVENANSVLVFITNLINSSLTEYASYARLISLGIVAASLIALPLIYMSTKGRLYYVTNKRIVVREKIGTVQVTTLPLDNLVEVTAFQGLFGRLLGYGDVVLIVSSGGGASDSLQPGSVSPFGSLYKVKRRLEGLKEVWELKDLIITLRESYVQANYLQNMEKELRRIREAVEEKPAKAKIFQPIQYRT